MWRKKKRHPASYADHFRPPDTVPITRSKSRPGLLGGAAKLLAIGGTVYYIFFVMGIPAVLWEYKYIGGGSGYPDYHTACTYIALNGKIYSSLRPIDADRCSVLILVDRH